jgi:predicted NBD/HSP70 family sugar kinase
MTFKSKKSGATGRASAQRRSTRAGSRVRLRRVDAERHSLSVILNLIRAQEGATRQDIERISGLGRAIVVDRLATLSRFGLVREGALGRATGGRAPRLVKFSDDAGLILLAILDTTSIGVGIGDLSGRLLTEHHEAADLSAGPNEILKRLATLFDWMIEQLQPTKPVWGIGLAISGPVEGEARPGLGGGKIHFLPDWSDYPIGETLARRYRAPVVVRTGTQMRALGELRAGSGIGSNEILFVEVAKDISASIVSEGHLLRGAQGAAGLIGHIGIGDDNPLVCRCGNTGCIETVAGRDAIVRVATEAAQAGESRYLADVLATGAEITPADIGLAAQRGDAFCARLLSRCGRQIGTVLAGVVNTINPSLVVLSGEVAMTGDIFLAAIREAIYSRAHPLASRDLRIIRSPMGGSAALVGAAFTVIDEMFAPPFLAEWVATGSPQEHPRVVALAERPLPETTAEGREAAKPPVYAQASNRGRRNAAGRQR